MLHPNVPVGGFGGHGTKAFANVLLRLPMVASHMPGVAATAVPLAQKPLGPTKLRLVLYFVSPPQLEQKPSLLDTN